MGQEQLQKQGHTSTRPIPREPKKYKVLILNDDFTTFEFVIMVMMTVFGKTETEAIGIAETTHTQQKAVVGTYSKDIAESKVAKTTAMARAESFPLRFDIQEA